MTGTARPPAGAITAAALLALAAGCELVSEPIRATRGGLVVHAVLNPSVCPQHVLVEELLTGLRTPVLTQDSEDEIRLAGGIPVTDARVVIRRQGVDSAVGRQRLLPNGTPTGVYVIDNDRCPGTGAHRLGVRPGDGYDLFVTTPSGRRVTGATRIPRPTATPAHIGPQLYNVDTDSFRIEARPADLADRYILSVNKTRWGAITLRVQGPHVQVRGQLRYAFDFEEANVFWPGMLHRVVLAATDRHYGDYVMTWSDPLTGRGQVHGVVGGFGLFGSVSPLGSILLDVTADEDHPVEGQWQRIAPADGATPYPILRLYVDDGEAADELGIHLIGSVEREPTTHRERLRGHLDGTRIDLRTAQGALASGELRGDSLFLRLPEGTALVYRKQGGRAP